MPNWPEKKELVGQENELAFQSGWNSCRKQFMKVIEAQKYCEHDWVWSNNSGKYFCSKCNDWSYLGNHNNFQVTSESSPKSQPKELSGYLTEKKELEFDEKITGNEGANAQAVHDSIYRGKNEGN